MSRREVRQSAQSRSSAGFERLGDLLVDMASAPASMVAASMQQPAKGRRVSAVESPASSSATSSDARRVALVWAEAVGTEIANNAMPLRLQQGRLTVAVSSSAWAQTLQLMGEEIKTRLNQLLGEDLVANIMFRHAGWEEQPALQISNDGNTDGLSRARPASNECTSREWSEEQRAAIASVELLNLDQRIKEGLLRAMRASFRSSVLPGGAGSQDQQCR